MLCNCEFLLGGNIEGVGIWLSQLVGVYEVKLPVLEIEKGSKMVEEGRHFLKSVTHETPLN